MKFVTYLDGEDGPKLGALVEGLGSILDLQGAYRRLTGNSLPAFSSLQALIEAGEEGLSAARAVLAEPDERDMSPAGRPGQLLAPLPQPQQIRDCLCFEAHLIGAADSGAKALGMSEAEAEERKRVMLANMRARPYWYKANRFSVSGHDSIVTWPGDSSFWDYELELGAVIGKQCRSVTPSEVPEYIFGFTIFNDFTARDLQGPEMQMGFGVSRSKDFDGGNGLGPCVVTIDEFDFRNARMIARVNGEVRCDNNSNTMTTSFEELISYISQGETIHPGEIILSGTVGGGCGMEFGKFLASGDVVELEIAGIGTLKHTVVAGAPSGPEGGRHAQTNDDARTA